MSTKPKPNPREEAVCKAARDALHIELSMEHTESVRQISMLDLRRALEQAYDLGRKSALS